MDLHEHNIEELGLDDRIAGVLDTEGFATVGDLLDEVEEGEALEHGLQRIDGIGRASAEKIAASVRGLVKQLEAEDEPEDGEEDPDGDDAGQDKDPAGGDADAGDDPERSGPEAGASDVPAEQDAADDTRPGASAQAVNRRSGYQRSRHRGRKLRY